MINPNDPLICYCGKATKIYDSLFRRNFCSDNCSTNLRLFLGGTDKTTEIMKEIEAGDFKIKGSVVTLHETLAKHHAAKVISIDKIDAQIQQQQEIEKYRTNLKKLGFADERINAMLEVFAAKKGEP